MLFSFEVPISYMKKFDKINDYHFILAHMLQRDKDYAKFYKYSSKYKILDNGCAELGESIDFDILLKLAVDFKVNVLVLPDVWMDKKSTLRRSLNFLQILKANKNNKKLKNMKFMFVVQGKTVRELQDCINTFIINKFRWVNQFNIIYGLPYLTCAKICGIISPNNRDDDVTFARIYLFQKLKLYTFTSGCHLLGAGFNFTQELSFMRHFKQIKTVDTSTPFVLALNNIKLDKYGLFDRVINKSGTLNFYEPFNKKVLRIAIHNANIIKRSGKL